MRKKVKRPQRTKLEQARSARLLKLLRAGRDQRETMVRKIKNKIRAQSYENPLKLQVCADRLLDELSTK